MLCLQGILKQSEGRRQYVESHPLSALCRQQMKEENYLLPACREAIASATYLDQYRFLITYDRLSKDMKTLMYRMYTLARNLASQNVSEDIVTPKGKEGQIEIGVMFATDLKSVNVSIDSPILSSEFKKIYVADWIRPMVVVHPEHGMYERVGLHLFKAQHFRKCLSFRFPVIDCLLQL